MLNSIVLVQNRTDFCKEAERAGSPSLRNSSRAATITHISFIISFLHLNSLKQMFFSSQRYTFKKTSWWLHQSWQSDSFAKEVQCQSLQGPATLKVWQHFKWSENKQVVCTLCKVSLAQHSSTSAVHKHVKRKHRSYSVCWTARKDKTTSSLVYSCLFKCN